MPAKSKAQYRFMAFCAHADHPAKDCPSRSVSLDYTEDGLNPKLPERKSLKERLVKRRDD